MYVLHDASLIYGLRGRGGCEAVGRKKAGDGDAQVSSSHQ
jgi:hypothetical protein